VIERLPMKPAELSNRRLKDVYTERMAKLAQLRLDPVERLRVHRELRGLTVERNRRFPPVQ
jgi:hypothetical protein